MTDTPLFDAPEVDGADDELTTKHPLPGQHRLTGIQLVNWGTFSDYQRIAVSERGFLLTGPSGSGKSTILDAISVVLVRPRDLHLNAAAGDATARVRDRSVLSYLRGAWSINADEVTGEVGTQQLRPGTTWSAIALDYSDGTGVETTLVRVFWAARGVKDQSGVKSANLIFDRRFDLRDLEAPLRDGLNRRTLKLELSPFFESEEFPAFQEKFARRLGIGGERALRLLHKTQATKGLSSLDVLLRDFMLDEPETLAIAARMVEQFDELALAHASVQTARHQVAHLADVRELDAHRHALSEHAGRLSLAGAATDWYVAGRAIRLHEEAIERTEKERADAAAAESRVSGELAVINTRVDLLREQHSSAGGGRLDGIRESRRQAETELSDRARRAERLQSSLTTLGAPRPSTEADYVDLVRQAKHEFDELTTQGDTDDDNRYRAFDAQKTARSRLDSTVAELKILATTRSNVDSADLRLRDEIAAAAGVDARRLPFVAELLEVPEEHAEWRGAIERLLGGFARNVLIPESAYRRASEYIEANHLGRKLLYSRVPHTPVHVPQAVGEHSVVRRIEVAESPFNEWLHAELSRRFDYTCAASLADFQNAERAITRNGQVKHGSSRHEKNDRSRIDDRRQWVLGFDNTSKQQQYERDAAALRAELQEAGHLVDRLKTRRDAVQGRIDSCRRLIDTPWRDVDTASAAQSLHEYDRLIAYFEAQHHDLARLDAEIAEQRGIAAERSNQLDEIRVRKGQASGSLTTHRAGLTERTNELAALDRPDDASLAHLDERFSARVRNLSLERLGEHLAGVQKDISKEESDAERGIQGIRGQLTTVFATFKAEWPAEAADADTDAESTPEYLAILERIEHDGLPEFESKFLALLQELSTMSLGQLRRQLDQERRQIKDRIDPINESLQLSEYGRGTTLRIVVKEKQLALVAEFKRDVAAATNESLVNDPARATERFELLRRLITRFGSSDLEHRQWRDQVLDVRRHVEFEAHEIASNGDIVEIHTSGVGRSGGQRVKLVTFALAAALRYQLGGRTATTPRYGAVVIDEAFDKADADFTEKSMRIFQEFGFQMILATPMKMVQTLSAFIGGAAVVDIQHRKDSTTYAIDLVKLIANPTLEPSAPSEPEHTERDAVDR